MFSGAGERVLGKDCVKTLKKIHMRLLIQLKLAETCGKLIYKLPFKSWLTFKPEAYLELSQTSRVELFCENS